METISIYELKRMNLRDATVIDGFPSVGLVSSIVANYLINALELEQIGILDSIHFPAVSLVRNSEPLNTVRIYAGERVTSREGGDQIVVFISEFQPPASLVRGIAKTVLDWVQEQRCRQLICPEGLTVERVGPGEEEEEGGEAAHIVSVSQAVQEVGPTKKLEREIGENKPGAELDANGGPPITVFGLSSTMAGRKLLEKGDIPLFQDGVITGLAGVLLNEGKIRDFPVLGLFAEARPDYPDARAAAKVIEALDKIMLHIRFDPRPLYKEAEGIEARLKEIHQKAKVVGQVPPPYMYG